MANIRHRIWPSQNGIWLDLAAVQRQMCDVKRLMQLRLGQVKVQARVSDTSNVGTGKSRRACPAEWIIFVEIKSRGSWTWGLPEKSKDASTTWDYNQACQSSQGQVKKSASRDNRRPPKIHLDKVDILLMQSSSPTRSRGSL